MATLVFTAVGSALGGPVGGLVGALLGQRVDSVLFAPGGRREGPRLQELAVQTSSYGTQLPALFGTVRAAGTVIWATDLRERRDRVSGGKGRPSTMRYSYSVSLAIALSSRPLLRVGRIWAEGNLLRGADGSFKVPTEFRFHSGHRDQQPDPLIASAEGPGNCPAFRDIAYAVFENLELGDFGNRIPSLTFELFERDGSVTIAEICTELSHGLIVSAIPDSVVGYAGQGDSMRTAIAPLLDACLVQSRPDGDRIELFRPADANAYAGSCVPVYRGAGQDRRQPTEYRAADRRQPAAVTLRYYDPARDYQAGVQRSGWSTSGELHDQLELPAVLDTATAASLARNRSAWRQARRDRRAIAIAIGPEPLTLGQSIERAPMRATSIEHFAGYCEIECESWPMRTAAVPLDADTGRHQPSPDARPGQSMVALVELPSLGTTAASVPILAVAAGGSGDGWRSAAIARVAADGLVDLGAIETPSAIGALMEPLPGHPDNLLDSGNIITLRIDSNAEPVAFNGTTPFSPDAPYLLVGPELVRCGVIEPLGGNVYRVSQLLRGCSGTAVASHLAGTMAVFPDLDRMLFPEIRASDVGSTVAVQAQGLGDLVPATAELVVTGLALLPFAPVHGRAARQADGSLEIGWIRRARHDPGWLDNVDMPRVETRGAFDIEITYSGSQLFAARTEDENLAIDPVTVNTWSVPIGAAVTVHVREVGDYGVSTALTFAVRM